MARGVTNVEQSVMEYIHGGIDEFNNKMHMVREISSQVQEIFDSNEVANRVLVKPDYFDEMLKLIVVLIGEASNIKDIVRYMEIMQHELLLEKRIDYTQIIGLTYSSIGHKLSKDIISFYLKANKINMKFYEDLFSK